MIIKVISSNSEADGLFKMKRLNRQAAKSKSVIRSQRQQNNPTIRTSKSCAQLEVKVPNYWKFRVVNSVNLTRYFNYKILSPSWNGKFLISFQVAFLVRLFPSRTSQLQTCSISLFESILIFETRLQIF